MPSDEAQMNVGAPEFAPELPATPRLEPPVPSIDIGFSHDAVETMRRAVASGGGRMAQFAHPELGGFGQWMHGGMVMTSAGPDRVLERRIDRLCEALVRERTPDARGTPEEDTAGSPASGPDRSTDASSALFAIEKLADLAARGIVDAEEFATTKAELLARI